MLSGVGQRRAFLIRNFLIVRGKSFAQRLIQEAAKMERSLRSVVNQFVAVAFVLLSLFIVSAMAQVSKGSISGTVIDPSGAVVSGAEGRATDLATNQVLSTNSDDSCLF